MQSSKLESVGLQYCLIWDFLLGKGATPPPPTNPHPSGFLPKGLILIKNYTKETFGDVSRKPTNHSQLLCQSIRVKHFSNFSSCAKLTRSTPKMIWHRRCIEKQERNVSIECGHCAEMYLLTISGHLCTEARRSLSRWGEEATYWDRCTTEHSASSYVSYRCL